MNYHKYIQSGLKMDRLQQEYDNLDKLLSKLVNHRYDYATHKDTGLVYDVTIIKGRLNEIWQQLRSLKVEMNDNE